ncbi:hypothetical protein I580_01723 [Enterococcus caccae ATCC BAA-1240]|uniref:Uncharacterized protein n=1 Tax=Enterococcus caccae ATCC BAA-1240 TaxID=1158612 RepID=R3TXZ2_9ENTE|nr:hypothetical protein UC7_01421 [Enterococcus caccae ATCC BAA-1240]EOT60823.1 hypothetical protein I580_01723 [Enterococcus caccae ATCC BAA-1240]
MEELLISINSQLNKYADTVAQRDQQDASSFGLNQTLFNHLVDIIQINLSSPPINR